MRLVHCLSRGRILLFLFAVTLYSCCRVFIQVAYQKNISNLHLPASLPVPVDEFQGCPFNPGQSKAVLILAYQRTGSTFLGSFFNRNSDVFYLFEPIDSLYTSLYGTQEGWNVPIDIFAYPNRTERVISRFETKKIASFVQNLFACNVDSLPTEMLLHRFFRTFQVEHVYLKKYSTCLANFNLSKPSCNMTEIYGYCGTRFSSASETRHRLCHQLLWNDSFLNNLANSTVTDAFARHKECRSRMRSKLNQHCVAHFNNTCMSKTVKVMKTVRLGMTSVSSLIKDIPNLRVIHLIRDPRSVVLSRKAYDTSAKHSSTTDKNIIANEAFLYCRRVLNDVRVGSALQKFYPGRLLTIFYEDYVLDPAKYAKGIYRFLDLPLSSNVMAFIRRKASKRVKSASDFMRKWENQLTIKQFKDVMRVCHDFYNEIPRDWPGLDMLQLTNDSIAL